MRVYRLINNPIDSNCFVVEGEIDNRCIVIDPGTEDCLELFALLDKRKLTVQYIFLTHEHIDHVAGCATLKNRFPDSLLVCSDTCAKNLNNTRFNLSRLVDQFTPIDYLPKPEIIFGVRVEMKWQGKKVLFYKATGHSQGSSHAMIEGALFVGDTFILHYKSTTTLPGASKYEMIKTFLFLLNDGCRNVNIIYPGHFESCTVEQMKSEIEPQLAKLKVLNNIRKNNKASVN